MVPTSNLTHDSDYARDVSFKTGKLKHFHKSKPWWSDPNDASRDKKGF